MFRKLTRKGDMASFDSYVDAVIHRTKLADIHGKYYWFFFFFLTQDIYAMVDLYSENGFLRTILQTRWSLRCEMRGEVFFKKNISTRICQFSFFYGDILLAQTYGVYISMFWFILHLFVIMVLTSMTVISWWWKHYYY